MGGEKEMIIVVSNSVACVLCMQPESYNQKHFWDL